MKGLMLSQFKPASRLLMCMMILTGVLYPVSVTLLGQSLFPWQANGSLMANNNEVIGSALIGQSFTDDKYFWGRPSATVPYPYNASQSGASNLGPSNPALFALIKQRVETLRHIDAQNQTMIPVDLVTASASGLDPDISPLAAFYQVPRVAKARGLSKEIVKTLVINSITPRTFGVLGEPRVNVLQLNLMLDQFVKVRSNNIGP